MTAVSNCAIVPVIPTIVVWSPVFVPLFVPVISEVNARVPSASFSVYVLLAVFVFVKNEVNVLATLRSPNIPVRNVCIADQVFAVERVVASVVYVVFVALSPVFVPLTAVVPVTASVGVAEPDIATVLYLPPVISPVVSAMVTAESCMSFPVVESNRAIALSVEDAGHTTSPVPDIVAHFVPVASEESTVKTCQFVPIARRDAVFDPVPTARSPLASHIASVATEPPPEYCGIFRVSPISVAGQLEPVVVSVISHCLPSNCVCIDEVTPST